MECNQNAAKSEKEMEKLTVLPFPYKFLREF